MLNPDIPVEHSLHILTLKVSRQVRNGHPRIPAIPYGVHRQHSERVFTPYHHPCPSGGSPRVVAQYFTDHLKMPTASDNNKKGERNEY